MFTVTLLAVTDTGDKQRVGLTTGEISKASEVLLLP
jgi:hypothetical protein